MMRRYTLPRRDGINSTTANTTNTTNTANTFSNRHHGRSSFHSLTPYNPRAPHSRVLRSSPSTSSPGPDTHHEHHFRNGRRTLRSHIEYDAGYSDGVGQDGFTEGARRGHQRGLQEGYEQGYDQGCSDGFFQLYAIHPDSDSGAGHGDTASPYAGNTVEIDPVDVHRTGMAGSDMGAVIPIIPEPEPVTYLTPVSPSAPLVRVASVPNLREATLPPRPSSAQAMLHYDEKAVDTARAPSPTPEPPAQAPSETTQDNILSHNDTGTDRGQEPQETDTETRIETKDQVDESVQPNNQQEGHPDHPGHQDTHLVHTASPAAHTAPTVFSDLFIFPYQRNPVLVYPSSLSYPTPVQHNDPNQPLRSEYIAEAYAEHHQRPRQSGFSIYQVQPGQLTRNMDSLRTTTDAAPHDPLSAFPAVFPVTGSLPASPVLPFSVPDHVVYKYAARPYQLARCVRHSLTTCPMCAVTPSHCFLGPGESVARSQVFRPNGILRPPAHDYTEAGAYTFPVGLGRCPKSAGESSLSEIQHPDEADPRRSLLFDPRLDPEVLGRHPLPEDFACSVLDTDTNGRLPDTFYCEDCGGLTWLKTKRKYYMEIAVKQEEQNGQKVQKDDEKESKGKKRKTKRGRRGKKDKAKTQAKTDTDTDSSQPYELTLGTSHPSHHASFNESWSGSPSWSSDGTADIFPEESGTTRSLFVQVAVQSAGPSADPSASMSTLAAFFGARSHFNNRAGFDLATATDGEGRLLRALPFERFNRNAPHLAAVALALHQVWTGVVPSHRTAIDHVTRWNSDHARRKAYRFRAIVVTASAYVVDLFCNDFKSKWQRHLKQFEKEEAIEAAGDDGDDGDGGDERREKEELRQAEKSKNKAKRARDKAKKAKKTKKTKKAKKAKKAKQKADQQPVELGLTVYDHELYAEEGDDDDDHDIHDTSYDSRTPSSGASPQQQQHQHQHHDETWGVLAGLAESMHDTLDFERPGIGRYVYVDTRDMKRLLPNGVLVHLVSRYMDLLRWHGVHVAFCHAQDGSSTEGARELAAGLPSKL